MAIKTEVVLVVRAVAHKNKILPLWEIVAEKRLKMYQRNPSMNTTHIASVWMTKTQHSYYLSI